MANRFIMDNQEYKKFQIVKSYVKNKIGKKRAHLWKRDLDQAAKNLDNTGQVLAQLFEKHIKEHNSKIDATCTRIDNLKYKNHKTYQSSLITGNGVPFSLIDKLLKESPEKDWYDIYLQLVE